MSDQTLNNFDAQGTNAERLAFVPDPPSPVSGPDPGYLFFETDTETLWAWNTDTSAWVQITSGSPFTNPMTTSQDLIVGGSAGTPTRKGVGTNGQVLTVGSGGLVDWATPAAVGGAITTSGYTMATARVLGRDTAGTGAIEELTVTGTGSVVKATSPTLVTPALGTPSAAVLTNATGLPVASGISGLGSNVAAFLATPSSANLAAALTDETGTGANVFATSPTLVTPALGTPTALVLTNATAVPAGQVTGVIPIANLATGTPTGAKFIRDDGTLQVPGGSGTVNSGTANQLAYYPASAAAVSGTAELVVNGASIEVLTALKVAGFVVANHIPQLIKSADYVFVLADAGSHLYHPVADNVGRTFTIPANASVAYPIGTAISVSNRAATASVVAITTDTMTWLPSGGTGTRTIAQYGKLVAEKVTATEWEVTGVGIT